MKTLKERQLEALKLWKKAEEGNARAQFAVAESVASGEFPSLIAPVARRTITSVYEAQDRKADQFTTRKTVQDINVEEELNVVSFGDQSNIPGTNAGDTFIPGGLPRLLPREQYPQIGFTASGKKIKAVKFGEAFGIDWESIVRQRGTNINLVREAFTAFGQHAANQEEIDVAKLIVKSNGFTTQAGGGLNGAVAATITNASDLSVTHPDLSNPEDIARVIALANRAKLQVGADGTVQTIDADYDRFILLTTPDNAPALRQVLAARRIRRAAGSDGGAEWEETLDFGADITVVGWKWLRSIWSGFGKGWVLIPVGGNTDQLPVFSSNFLQGYEQPQFFVRDSNSRRLTAGGGRGGDVNPLEDGDFDNDAVVTKVRHVHGANALWTSGVVYSTGANA